jgi:hypothetical protein
VHRLLELLLLQKLEYEKHQFSAQRRHPSRSEPPTNKNQYPDPPKTPNHHKRQREREIELQIPPKHALPVPVQTHKCSNRLRIPEISASSKDFTARITRILGFQRLRIREIYREGERKRDLVSLSSMRLYRGPFSFY